jgi:hypothetical protein
MAALTNPLRYPLDREIYRGQRKKDQRTW